MIRLIIKWLKCKIAGHHFELYYCPEKKNYPLADWVDNPIFKCVTCERLAVIKSEK